MQILRLGISRCKIILPILICLLTGCGTDGNPVAMDDKIEKMLSAPYTADCTARVVSDKTENKYTYSCKCQEDGSYIVNYDDMTISLDGTDAVISKDGNEIKTEISDSNLVLIPSYFFEEYLKSGNLTKNDSGYVLSSDMSEDNPYRHTATMLLDEKLIPKRMYVKDVNENNVIEVEIIKYTKD